MSEFEDKINNLLSSPEDMEKIMGMARSLSGSLGGGGSGSDSQSEATPPKAQSPFGDFDPKLLKMASKLMGEYKSEKNDKTALIDAMKPYLKDDRKAALDKASGIVKIAHIAKIALSEMSGGGDD